jgi:tetratricopeptide (TPR) repeat protein
MNLLPRVAIALLATLLSLAAAAADAPAAASAPAGKCAAPGADRAANHACAVSLAHQADGERTAGRDAAALAALARADQFAPEDLRFAMARAGLALKLAGQLSPAGIEAASKATPADVGVTMLQAELLLARKDFAATRVALDRVLATRPGATLAWEMRATADVARPDFEAARGDVERALRLEPKSAAALRLRGIVRNNGGDHAGALADYQAAHALAPRPEDPFVIGSTQFLLHQFGDAATTLARRAPPAPDGTYWRLWRYMALARRDGVERASGSLGPGTPPGAGVPWPGPVVDFFHGTLDAATLLDAAARSQAARNLSQVCEAHFYMAEDALLRRHGDAFGLFRQAIQECPQNFHEYEGAAAELRAAGLPLAAPGPTLAAAAASAPASAASAASAAR